MENSVTKIAFEEFLSGNYEEALSLYEKLKSELGSTAFDYNIKKCQEKLDQHPATAKSKRREISEPVKKSIKKDKIPATRNNPKICCVRIIGNDLPGLHSDTQAIENLKFILDNEPEYPGVDKVFLLNRIVSDHKRQKIKDLIRSYGKSFFEVIFKKDEYLSIPFYDEDLPTGSKWLNKSLTSWEQSCWDVSRRKLKNAYLMNNNGARNYALQYGQERGYDWVLPWDGNCFLSQQQFEELQSAIRSVGTKDYLIVPMERCLENAPGLANAAATNAVEEPQIAFSKHARLGFDDKRVYGNQPKVELLKRLNVPGMWDAWTKESPWKEIVVDKDNNEAGKWVEAASVFRLASGNVEAAVSSKNRSHSRADAIIRFCDDVYEFCAKALANKSKVDYLYYNATLPTHQSDDVPATVALNIYFDNIYLVSLNHEKEKRYKVSSSLKKMGVNFEYFEAVNGYKGKPLQWFENYKKTRIGDLKHFKDHNGYEKNRNMKLIESPGAVGYLHTYINILKDAKAKGYKRILILEDDVLFCTDFGRRFSEFARNVGDDWKVLMLGASQYGWSKIDFEDALNQRFYTPTIHDTKGSFAIAFDISVYDEVIKNQEYMEAPFDNLPLGVIYEKYPSQCFVAFPNLVMPDVAKSTIRETRSQYEHANRVKWWVGDYQYPQKKITVGLLLNSFKNAKYLESFWKKALPYNLAVYIEGSNGLVPLHNLSQITCEYRTETIVKQATGCNLSIDVLLEVPEQLAVTQEMIEHDLDAIFAEKDECSFLLPVNGYEPEVKAGRVSVVIPTYKRPDHLRAAVTSVLQQDYSDLEVLIVDDNGRASEFDAETEQVVNSLKSDFEKRNIRYLKHQVNANGASARNTGILASTGEYICFLDDDDIYLEGRITKSVEALRDSQNHIGGVYCGFLGWNSPELDLNRFAEGDLTKEILLLDYKKHYLHTNTATYKREAIFDVNGFDPSYFRHQDLEFNIRFFESYRIKSVKDALVRLAPEKSAVDNKIYGMDMYYLKEKFLQQFSRIIQKHGEVVAKKIYLTHWSEAAKYAKKTPNVTNQIEQDFSNGALQMKLLLG